MARGKKQKEFDEILTQLGHDSWQWCCFPRRVLVRILLQLAHRHMTVCQASMPEKGGNWEHLMCSLQPYHMLLSIK